MTMSLDRGMAKAVPCRTCITVFLSSKWTITGGDRSAHFCVQMSQNAMLDSLEKELKETESNGKQKVLCLTSFCMLYSNLLHCALS